MCLLYFKAQIDRSHVTDLRIIPIDVYMRLCITFIPTPTNSAGIYRQRNAVQKRALNRKICAIISVCIIPIKLFVRI